MESSGLTLQPFGPKLPLSRYMHSKAKRVRLLALLLGFIFLGAQFHFCMDLSASPSATHFCPVCSVVGSAVTTQAPRVTTPPHPWTVYVAASVHADLEDAVRAL